VIVFDPATDTPARCQGLLSQLVVPRPIAMISTADADGVVNVAPYSYYMPVTGRPMLVAVTMGTHREVDHTPKHTYANAMRAGDFVVNVTTDALRAEIEVAAMEFPTGTSELEELGWTAVPSQRVSSPSIAESPAHLECVVHRVVDLGEQGVSYSGVHVVFGEVVCVVLDESVASPDCRVDQATLAPVGRMGFPWFNRSLPESMFQLPRVPYEEFVVSGRPTPSDA
jgi:flavin reductase (DIM6/NTAB) family NADH-FMN oxidoreductase RutF